MTKLIKMEKEVKKAISNNCACYVLITCTPPDGEGKMNVEMNYEGDDTLAEFLIENATQVFAGQKNRRKLK